MNTPSAWHGTVPPDPAGPPARAIRVFLCYSRRQFHAAEQLAMLLSGQGFDVWFDVQRLAPGDDWTEAVYQAVEEADVLVLLASPQALTSPYTEREWQQAQQAGTPVTIALVETAELPTELSDNPTVDLRVRFESGATELGTVLRTGSTGGPSHRGWRQRPVAIAIVTTALVMNVVAVLGHLLIYPVEMLMEVHSAPSGRLRISRAVAAPVIAIVFAAFLVQILHQFRCKRARFTPLWVTLLFAVPIYQYAGSLLNAVVFSLAHGVDENLELTDTETALSGGYYVITTLVLLPVNLVALGSLLLSRSTFRWLPPGDAPRWVRRRALRHPPDRQPHQGALRGSRTFVVHHAPADALMAEQVTAAFTDAGMTSRADRPDVHAVLVTNATDWAWAEQHLTSGPSVAVIGSSVRPPEAAEELQRLQWLDFRDGDVAALSRRVAWLIETRPGTPTEPPLALDRFNAPPAVRRTVRACLVLAAVFGVSAVLSMTVVAPKARDRNIDHSKSAFVAGDPIPGSVVVWARPNPDSVRDTSPHADTLLIVRAGLGGVLCVLALVVARRLSRRRLSPNEFFALAISIFGITALWVGLGIASEEPPAPIIAGYVIGGIAALFAGLAGITPVMFWLPVSAEPLGRSLLPSVGVPMLHVSLPLTLLVLTPLYISGVIL